MISSIEPGKVSDVFLVQECKALKTKKDKRPYTLLKFKDKSGEIAAFVWDKELTYSPGQFVKITGEAKEHKGELVLRIKEAAITPVRPPESLDKYLYSLDSLTVNNLWTELQGIINGVRCEGLKSLLTYVLDNHESLGNFNLKNAPLTDERYGAYAGALLEHIVYCCRHVKAVQQNYFDRNTPIDPDLLVAIVVFHDLGRLLALENTMNVQKSPLGKLMETSALSLSLLEQVIAKAEFTGGEWKLYDTKLLKLREGVVAASDLNSQPKTIESLIVKSVQQMDAMVGIYSRAINFARHGEEFVRLQAADGEIFNA